MWWVCRINWTSGSPRRFNFNSRGIRSLKAHARLGRPWPDPYCPIIRASTRGSESAWSQPRSAQTREFLHHRRDRSRRVPENRHQLDTESHLFPIARPPTCPTPRASRPRSKRKHAPACRLPSRDGLLRRAKGQLSCSPPKLSTADSAFSVRHDDR